MEEKLKKVPKLRFKDENGEDFPEWEVSAIKKIAKVYDGTHQTPQYCAEGIKFVSVEDIYNLSKSKKFISKEKYNKEFKIKPSFGDVFMTRIGDIGRVSIIRVKEPLAFYVSLALFKFSRESINSTFAFFYMQNSLFQSELWKRTLHIAFPKKINLGEIADCVINLPTLPEQTRIADFFTKLDSYIEQQKLEVEKLKEQKKGFMQKIFSQEIRFKDENGEDFPAWEEKKLEDIAEIIKGKQLNKLQLEKSGKYYVLNGGIVPSGYCNNYNTEANMISISEGGASCGYVNFNKERFWSGGHNYVIKTSQIEKKFLYQLLKFNEEKIMRLRVGSGLPNIQKNALKRLLLKVAISKEEQTRIADFFTKLDEQIEVEKAILEKWKLLKKGFLQQMFI